jgi:DNA helicase-2/ATP-dependent DNA helicase PcrA
MLMAEERDLRQVPASALHLDAVKLMTVHGSKGLEFAAVHVPGLTVASFPLSDRGERCPPPTGMIAGAEGMSGSEESKRAHDDEEECLFFVAVSRARTHLVLHLARKQPNGNNRSPSPFVSWIPTRLIDEIAEPRVLPLPVDAPRLAPVSVLRSGSSHVTNSQLASYEKCPRRFFYTHILGLGGARKTTAFTRTHDCLYELIAWLADARREKEPSLEEAEASLEAIWKERGPVDHGFAADYRRLASRLVGALVRAGAGKRFRNAEPLAIDFPSGRVVVEPSEILELPNGAVVLRRVRTGYKRSDEYDRLDYALYHLAGEARFGSRYSVEALHLTDETIETVTITGKKLTNRRSRSDQLLKSLSEGRFPPEINAVTCPRCPHFFICPAAPSGPLALA